MKLYLIANRIMVVLKLLMKLPKRLKKMLFLGKSIPQESLLDSSLMYILSQVLIELDIWKILSTFFLQMTTVSWGWWQATQLEDGAQKGHWGEEGGPHLPLYPERGQRHTPSILFPRWMAALWVILFYFYRILWMQQGLPLKTVSFMYGLHYSNSSWDGS